MARRKNADVEAQMEAELGSDFMPPSPPVMCSPADFELLEKLNKDIRAAARTMGRRQVAELCNIYYDLQKLRISTSNQAKAKGDNESPNQVPTWFSEQFTKLENDIKRMLNEYVNVYATGRWALSICGVGPVIAAGLITHIDITKAPTVGCIWSFAGLLDPKDVKWGKGQKRPFNATLRTLCVRPDQVVTTRRGYIPIAEIKVGDEVLTHKGRWRPVTKVIVNEYDSEVDGDLVGLRLFGAANQVAWVTPEHPVYCHRQRVCVYEDATRGSVRWRRNTNARRKVKVTDAQVNSMKQMRSDGSTLKEIADAFGYSQAGVSLITRNLLRATPNEDEGPSWQAAADVKPGWLGFAPKIPSTGETFSLDFRGPDTTDRDGIVFPTNPATGKIHGNAAGLPPTVVVDEDMARLIGLYAAEGHASTTSGQSIGFSFHLNETEYHGFVKATLESKFGRPAAINLRPEGNAAQVICCSTLLARRFKEWFGKDAHHKKLPVAWIGADHAVLAAMVRGMFEGDGHLNEDQITYGTVSGQLARWLTDALLRLGISASMCQSTRYYAITVHDRRAFRKVVMKDTDGDLDANLKNSAIKSAAEDGNWYAFRQPLYQPYSGPVYNLEVEEDHSYVVSGMSVHNCAYKLGESFVKVQNRDSDVYGKLFADRKRFEWARNKAGYNRERCAQILTDKKIGKDTDAYAWYSGQITPEALAQWEVLDAARRVTFVKTSAVEPGHGLPMLPPAHIHAMARRWAVKLFVAHYHHVAFVDYYQQDPPKPYIFEHQPPGSNHRHYIAPPNFPWQGGGKSLRDMT